MILNAMSATSLWNILAAAAACFVIAGVYFGALTPKYYAIALGRQNLPPEKPSALVILGPFLCNLVMIVTTATLMRMVAIQTLSDALALGALVAIGYMLAMCMMIAINPNFPKPFYYTVLNAPFLLLNSLVTCTILFLMQ
jgi:hypothetical protein